MAYTTQTQKIDKLAVDGLLGTNNSLAYKVHEIEKHFHSREVWYGLSTTVAAGVTEGEAWSVLEYESISATTSVFGAWVPVLGSGDTPFKTSYAKFEPHRIIITDTAETKKPHLFQIAWGATTGAQSFTNGDYTGFWTTPEKDGKASPVDVQCPRITAGDKVWIRHLVLGESTSSVEFFIGMHEYAG